MESKLNVTTTDNQLATDMKQAIWSDLNARYADPVVSTYYGSVHGGSSDPPVESDEATAENAEAPPPKRLKGLAAILKCIQEESEQSPSSSSLTPSQIIDKEIFTFIDFPGAESDTDPLAWWKCEQGRFPNLACIARKYLCICGTSVPSERVFSTVGYVASRSCGRLLPQNISQLLFLAKNMQ